METSSRKVTHIAQALQEEGLRALIIPSHDAHQSEYVSEKDRRIRWISNFTGSAGTAVLFDNSEAYLWTDGRYFQQAIQELEPPWKLMRSGERFVKTVEDFIKDNISPNDRVGLDPNFVSMQQWRNYELPLKKAGIILVPTTGLIDRFWMDKEEIINKNSGLTVHPLHHAGLSASEKIKGIQMGLGTEGIDLYVLAALDDIAWLFNLRGSDIPCNPFFYSFGIITQECCKLFLKAHSYDEDVKAHLGEIASELDSNFEINQYDMFFDALRNILKPEHKVWLDSNCSQRIYSVCREKVKEESIIELKPGKVALTKSVKNEAEIAGMKASHLIDAVSLVKFFSWLEGVPNIEQYDEVDVADKVFEFRSQSEDFRGLSFDTISAYGSNGAIIHYKPEKSSCKQLGYSELYLCDSGGQYVNGTTDITRSLHFGNPTEEEKRCFTFVLEAHCQLACAKFPEETPPYKLDVIARMPLWRHGMDYRHGTGHGVGSFLGVHEFPPLISSKAPEGSQTPVKAGNIISNEPGYYMEGKFGIRIENVVLVRKCEELPGFLEFETISLLPIQKKLVNVELLSDSSLTWLNEYHQKCFDKLKPYFPCQSKEYIWLRAATTKLNRGF